MLYSVRRETNKSESDKITASQTLASASGSQIVALTVRLWSVKQRCSRPMYTGVLDRSVTEQVIAKGKGHIPSCTE